MDKQWTIILITALTLSVAFTGWTANAVYNMREEKVSQAEYRTDMHAMIESIDKLRDTVYKLHMGP